MAQRTIFDNHLEPAWCPGCGNFTILSAVKQALVNRGLKPHEVLFVSGIGQAAKAPHYLRAHVFNGLHGRALPAATGAKLANPDLEVIVESGDGCIYGEGGNHFLAAIRRNVNLTVLVHNNQVYGLTKGQASPTSAADMITKAQPHGSSGPPFNPLATAIALNAGFVARGSAGRPEELTALIEAGMDHPGLALIDILQPCVSFNKRQTWAWYREHCEPVPTDHDHGDRDAALRLAFAAEEERFFCGILYRTGRPPLENRFPMSAGGILGWVPVNGEVLAEIIARHG
jgi:2-oxoglutarate ferredoxin oxidoreductase subunit beta